MSGKLTSYNTRLAAELRRRARQEEETAMHHAREAQRLCRLASKIEAGRAALAPDHQPPEGEKP